MTATRVALIACSRIILNRQYVPCSLYQMCLVRDSNAEALSINGEYSLLCCARDGAFHVFFDERDGFLIVEEGALDKIRHNYISLSCGR